MSVTAKSPLLISTRALEATPSRQWLDSATMSPPPAFSTLSTSTWRCATRSDYLHRLLGCDHAIDRHHRGDIDVKVIATRSQRQVTTGRAAVAGSIERFGLLNSRPGLGKTRGEHAGCCCGPRPNLAAKPVALVERSHTRPLPTHPSRPTAAPLRAARDALRVRPRVKPNKTEKHECVRSRPTGDTEKTSEPVPDKKPDCEKDPVAHEWFTLHCCPQKLHYQQRVLAETLTNF